MMPKKINKYGLSRNIPTDVAFEVRKRCGFGCVVCGNSIVDYDHYNPEFASCTEHQSDGIILLCPTHHRTKGVFIAKQTMRKWVSNPFCTKYEYSHHPIDIQNSEVKIGPYVATDCPHVLRYGDHPIVWFEEPEAVGAPPRLNMIGKDKDGRKLFSIINNKWEASRNNFDVIMKRSGDVGIILVRDKSGYDIFNATYEDGAINIWRLDIFADENVRIEADRNGESGSLKVNGRVVFSGSGNRVMRCPAAVVIGSDGSRSIASR